MSNHALGCYYALEHAFEVDRDYIRKLQPPVIRIFDNPDVQQIADMRALVPGAVIACRTWAIDDGSDEDHPSKQVNRINADPVGTAHDHAQQYRAQLDRWKQEASQRGLLLPDDQHIYFNSANEPNQGGELDKIAVYAVAFLDHCTELGLRATAPCLGVGWPDNTGPGTPVNWQAYIDAGLEQAIKRGQHWLELHEYFFKTGPQDNWTWWAGRHLQCPLDVPILLGEIGMDNLVADKRWDKEHDNRGWQGNATPDEYAEMIEWHIRHSDTRVVAALVFITDFRNREWESFNTRGAHGALLARKDAMVPQTKPMTPTAPPITTHLPAVYVPAPADVFPTPKPGTVTATMLNVRSGPATDYPVVRQLMQGDKVMVSASAGRAASTWLQIGAGEWVYDKWVSMDEEPSNPGPTPPVKPVEPTPAPTTGALDPLMLEAIVLTESNGDGFENGRLKIRMEAHLLLGATWGNLSMFKPYFRYDTNNILLAYFRAKESEPWMMYHANQDTEWQAFEFARQLDETSALLCTSMGAGQIMGFNDERIGYASELLMFEAFSRDEIPQTIGVVNYCLSDPALVQAIKDKDFDEITMRYNGKGLEAIYTPRLKANYVKLGGTV